jgi:predicted O-linked N-acetylglucosamine transferase (SPINDLY family)
MPTLFEAFLHGLKSHQAGRVEDAEKAYRWVIANDPGPAMTARIMLASLAPVIYRSMDELLSWRTKTHEELQKLAQSGNKLDLTREWAPHNFYSAYHGFDDKPEQVLRASLYRAPTDVPPLGIKYRSDGKIRIGLCSAYFKDHTIGKLNIGLLRNIDRAKFHVTVISAGGPPKDAVAQEYKSRADQFVELPPAPLEARKRLAQVDLDALYYADIGMNPMTFSFGFSRFASVQVVTWGHPITTGIPTIDYYLSSEHLDRADGQQFYTEKLLRLPDLAIAYDAPPEPQTQITRAQLGLPADCTVYGCLQSLYKIHPQFDAMLGDILRADPKGRVLFLSGMFPQWDMMLRERFAKSIPDVADRIHFAPRQNRDGFLAVNKLCDLMLDPLHFGGGNTSWEALAMNVPIVTLPSSFLRGRITNALYHAMGYTDLCAKDEVDYVQIATRLGTDAAERAKAKQTIAERVERIIQRKEGIRQFETWLQKNVNV